MPRTSVLLSALLLSWSAQAVDLNIGFKNHYELEASEIESLVDHLNDLAGEEIYGKGPRRVSADGLRLECVSRNKRCKKDIPLFTGKAGIDATAKPGDIATASDLNDPEKAPWRSYRVNDPKSAHELTLVMQKYVYEGWLKHSNKQDSATHFKRNDERTWCMVPWMNQIPGNASATRKGRDMVHGLTKEFPIDNSAAYNDIPFKKKIEDGRSVEDTNSFSSYGVAYFNRPNCEHLINIFGDESNPKDPKKWLDARVEAIGDQDKVRGEFETQDGSVSVKMLFTTLQAEDTNEETHGTYPALKEAYKWVAHVSTERGSSRNMPRRFMQKVSHVQMDIAIKDTGILGLADKDIPWVMLNYYFDPNYINPIFDMNSPIHLSREEIAKTPEGLKHMRPIGVQYGLDRGHSIIVYEPGVGVNGQSLGIARNNHQPPGPHAWSLEEQMDFFANGSDYFTDTRLNGPADNPRSSCLGCHASSGVNRFARYYGKDAFPHIEMTKRTDKDGNHQHPVVGQIHQDLGVLDNHTYNTQVVNTLNVDFNQQIRIGLERYLRAK